MNHTTMKAIIFVMDADYSVYNRHLNAIRYAQTQGLEIVGIATDVQMYRQIDGYPVIPLENLKSYDIDLLIVASDTYQPICRWAASSKNVNARYIVPIKVFSLPGFELEKYLRIVDNTPTIISNNCWGGFTYNTLGLSFASPFVNMFIRDEGYLKLLSDMPGYMQEQPQQIAWGYDGNREKEYPICMLRDVEIHFNHYDSMEEVLDKWNQRVSRMNWENLFVMMYTKDEDAMQTFVDYQYSHKVCFVPEYMCECEDASIIPVIGATRDILDQNDFGLLVDAFANGQLPNYNVLDLLLGNVGQHRVS